MTKNKPMLMAMATIFAIFLVSYTFISEQEIIEQKPFSIKKPIAVRMPDFNKDLVNDKEGSITIQMKIDIDNIIKELNTTPDYLIFFSSKILSQLHLIYNLGDNTIEGGLPPMKSVPVKLDKDKVHTLTYAFKENDVQKIYFDGVLIASSHYTGTVKSLLTGSAIRQFRNEITYNNDIYKEVTVWDKKLSDENVATISN